MTPDYSSFGLQNEVAVVTGPLQGIGRAIAIGLARVGARLVPAKHPASRHEDFRELQAETNGFGARRSC